MERNLINHKEKNHPQNKIHNCGPCMKDFSNMRSLNKHFKKFHKGLNKFDLSCKVCNIVFATKTKLKSHKRHKHEASTCWKCSKVFISGDKLRLHRKSCYKSMKKENTH